MGWRGAERTEGRGEWLETWLRRYAGITYNDRQTLICENMLT